MVSTSVHNKVMGACEFIYLQIILKYFKFRKNLSVCKLATKTYILIWFYKGTLKHQLFFAEKMGARNHRKLFNGIKKILCIFPEILSFFCESQF